MVRTIVGYAGGTKDEPTYRRMGDHTEVVRVVYHPKEMTYSELLDVFWAAHDPTYQSGKRQYWNAVFYHNEKQKQAAEKSLEKRQKKQEGRIATRILPVRSFTRAEQYHQKYYLQKNDRLIDVLDNQFDRPSTLLDSTVATRTNAFLAGTINENQLRNRLDQPGEYQLPDDALKQVETLLCGGTK